MRIFLQILQTHSSQTAPSIILTIGDQRYFFNIPEGFQRFYKEHGLKFTDGNRFFLTQLTSHHVAGSLAIATLLHVLKIAKNTQFYGPPGFSKYCESIQFRVHNRDMFRNTFEFHENALAKHSPFQLNQIEQDDMRNLANPCLNRKENVYKDKNVEIHSLLLSDGKDKEERYSLCYILKLKKMPGKVNSEKLKTHGITQNNIKKLLEVGEVEIGGVIHKVHDFKEPDHPSSIAIIIDCPTEAHFDSLLKQEKIQRLFSNDLDPTEESVKVVVHMTPSKVLTEGRYAEFLKMFDPNCQHIFVNEDLMTQKPNGKDEKEEKKEEKEDSTQKETDMTYAHFELTNILATYFPNHFPVLKNLESTNKFTLDQLFPFLKKKAVSQKLAEFIFFPVKSEGLQQISLLKDRTSTLSSLPQREAFVKGYQQWLEKAKNLKTDNPLFKNCDPELIFLGTQSMQPSNFCNVSGIYLRFWQQDDLGILLDCGEGTYFQLLHHHGPAKAKEFLKKLKVIYITHAHSDHHMGILQLITERDKALAEDNISDDPVFLVMPYLLSTWVNKFSKMVNSLNYQIVFINHLKTRDTNGQEQVQPDHNTFYNPELLEGGKYYDVDMKEYMNTALAESESNAKNLENFLLNRLGICKFNSVDAEHCFQAFGIYFEHKDGWSFAYSGDTRPYQRMIDQINKVTILVHEASFSDDLRDEAFARKHSTDKEAVEVGMKVNAWRTLLTHFSMRYEMSNQNKEHWSEELKAYLRESVVVGRDHFRMKLSELEYLPEVSKCISKLFDDL